MKINIEKQRPEAVASKGEGHWFADFGKAAFGRLEYEIEVDHAAEVELVIGEVLAGEQCINRAPGGYRCIKTASVRLEAGLNHGFMFIKKHRSPYQDTYQRSKVLVPENAGGEIAPFRYAEVHGDVKRVALVRHALFAPFDDDAADFHCSDAHLNQVWELCKYTMKATSAFGLYIDGERERQCFEGDAYINALGAYCTGGGYEVARRTLDFLASFYPIPAVEYRLFTPLLVRDYFLYSGDTGMYPYWKDELKERLLPQLLADDGLFHFPKDVKDEAVRSLNFHYQYVDMFPDCMSILVDWPRAEQDGYEFGELSFVPHAFLYAALKAMNDLEPNSGYDQRAASLLKDIRRLFRHADGRYCDSSQSNHSAIHSAMWAIAWGIADKQDYPVLAELMKGKGMVCSVYAAQFLLDACFMAGAEQFAIDLMRSDGPRSWMNMIRQGTTITMEAWSDKDKSNQDWNHAWGAAPANVIPRRLAGIRPIANGFRRFVIDPKPGNLEAFSIKHPTPHGPIFMEYQGRHLKLTVPDGTEALCGDCVFTSGKHDVKL